MDEPKDDGANAEDAHTPDQPHENENFDPTAMDSQGANNADQEPLETTEETAESPMPGQEFAPASEVDTTTMVEEEHSEESSEPAPESAPEEPAEPVSEPAPEAESSEESAQPEVEQSVTPEPETPAQPEEPAPTEEAPAQPEAETAPVEAPQEESAPEEAPAEQPAEAAAPAEETQAESEPTPPAEQPAEAPVEAAPAAEPEVVEAAPAATPEQPAEPEPVMAEAPAQPETQEAAAQTAPSTEAVETAQAVAPEAAAAASVSEQAQKGAKKGWRRWLAIIGLPLIALIVLGGATFGGYVYYQLNKPENILLQAVGHTFDAVTGATSDPEISSFALDGTITIKNADNSETPPIEIGGLIDVANEASQIDVGIDLGLFKLAATLGIFQEEGFLKVDGVDALGALFAGDNPEVGALTSQVNDQWISIEESLLNSIGISLQGGEKLTDEEKDRFADAFIDHRWVEFVEQLDSEDVDGVSNHHYKARFNSAELVTWAEEVREIAGDKVGLNDATMEIIMGLAQTLESLDYDMEVWIAKSDLFLRKMTMTIRDGSTTADIVLNASRYNEDLSLNKPEQSISLAELLTGLAPLLGGLDALGVDPTQLLFPQAAPTEENPTVPLGETSGLPTSTLGATDAN